MIPISQIDSQLSIYRNKKVVLWGTGKYGKAMTSLLQSYEISVSYYCDNNPSLWGTTFMGIPVISPETLSSYQQSHNDLLVQVSVEPKSIREKEILLQLKELQIASVISATEGITQVTRYLRISTYKENPALQHDISEIGKVPPLYRMENQEWMLLSLMSKAEFPIFVCMPAKTGDNTIMETLSPLLHLQQTHFPHWLHKKYLRDEKVKIITAVRDPIIKDLSSVYQWVSVSEPFKDLFPQEIPMTPEKLEMYLSNDIQAYFDQYVSHDIFFQVKTWFNHFSEQVVDLRKHPFDREKGYATVQEGNYDIFVFQLEKLNDLVPELSQWAGVELDQLKNANMASNKWIGSSYKQAKQDIKLTQEYFDACYNDSYIQHFYSQADIAAFQEHWKSHIKQ